MAARGEAVIGEGRSDECVGARQSGEWELPTGKGAVDGPSET